MESSVRLQNELKLLETSRPFGFYARPSTTNIYKWDCQIHSHGYFYQLILSFPSNYPLSPPVAKFKKSVYHPNVYSDNKVCVDLLGSKWSPSITVSDILVALAGMLDAPNPKSPANVEAAGEYLSKQEVYKKKVANCNKKHHSKYAVLKE